MSTIEIDVPRQQLKFKDRIFSVSTSKLGLGEKNGSLQTPRGRHIVRAKIGAGQPVNAVFVRRRPTGEVWTPALHEQYPGRDWILTRILWLSGCEPGRNRLGEVDTMRRYIYIHGSPDFAVSAKLLNPAFGSRVPCTTSWPCFRNPAASVFPTSPVPITPIFAIASVPCYRTPLPLSRRSLATAARAAAGRVSTRSV